MVKNWSRVEVRQAHSGDDEGYKAKVWQGGKKQEAFHGKEGWSCEIVIKDNIQSCCWKLEVEGPAGSEFESWLEAGEDQFPWRLYVTTSA